MDSREYLESSFLFHPAKVIAHFLHLQVSLLASLQNIVGWNGHDTIFEEGLLIHYECFEFDSIFAGFEILL